MLKGVLTAIVTPMKNQGEIDFPALDRLIEFQIAGGVAGIVIVGSTGESFTLDNDEKITIIKHAVEIIAQRVKTVVGVSFANTKAAIDFIDLLNKINGIDYLMALTPSYVRPTQEGLYQHFAALAKVSKSPMILYNVPARTACNLEDATTLRLAHDFPNIIGLKDATSDIARCCYLVKHKPPGFILLTGDDSTAMAFMLCGGDGVISVISNLVPCQFSLLSKYALNGDVANAIKLNNQILELHRLMFIEANPIPIKWALFNEGLINSPELRLPLTVLSTTSQNIIEPHLAKIMSRENHVTK